MNTTAVLQTLATWVLWNSSGAAVLVLLILAVRLIAGRAMSARLRSRLWLLVIVRLMIPMLPAVSLPSRMVASASSLLEHTYAKPITQEAAAAASAQAVERTPAHAEQVEIDNPPQFVVVEEGMVPPSVTPTPRAISATAQIVIAEAQSTPKSAPINWLRILLITWLAGTALLLVRLTVTTIRLSRLTRRLDLITDPKIVELLASCCDLFNLKRTPRLLAGGDRSAPALIGVIHPKILLPATLASQLSLDEIRLIFLHELAHLRRRDVLLNYFFAVLTALHWFNPLLWIASWRMAADRELACDEAVLRVTSRRHARLYGCTLLKLVELLNSQRLPAGAVGVVQNKTLIQRRIDMIASYPSRTPRSSLIVRCAAVSLALAAAVSAIRAQEAPAPVPESPSAPSALPAPVAVPPLAAKPEVAPAALPPAAAPIAPSIGMKPRTFTEEEIEPLSRKVQLLEQNVETARSALEALKLQGLQSKNKAFLVAAQALDAGKNELSDYVAEWNQNYTIQTRPDGTPIAVRKGSAAPAPEIRPPAVASAAVAAEAAPAPPGALPGVVPVAPAPAAGTPTPAATPGMPVPPTAFPGADGPAAGAPNAPMMPPAIAPVPAGENPYRGTIQNLKDALALFKNMYGADNPTVKQLQEQINDMERRRPPGVMPMGGIGMLPPGRLDGGVTQSVEDASARQANAEVMQKLAKSHTADFHGSVLREALSYIADGSGVDIVIDERTLSEISVDVNSQPVTLHVASRPMEQILSLTLRLASPHIDYSIYNGVVFVSSREALNRRIVTRIYDLPSNVDRDAMQQMIGSAVGTARCNFFEQKIVVTAPEVAQRDVARLLAQLGPVQPAGAAKAMLMFHLRNTKAAEVAAQFPKELGIAAAEDRTNSVLVTTTQADLVKDFIAKVDGLAQSDTGKIGEVKRRVDMEKSYTTRGERDLKVIEDRLATLAAQQQVGPSTKERADEIANLTREVSAIRESVGAVRRAYDKESDELHQMQKEQSSLEVAASKREQAQRQLEMLGRAEKTLTERIATLKIALNAEPERTDLADQIASTNQELRVCKEQIDVEAKYVAQTTEQSAVVGTLPR